MAENKVVEFINLECAECGAVELRMRVFGDIAVCSRCFNRVFGSHNKDPETETPALYMKLNKGYHLKVGDYRYTEEDVVNKVGVATSQGQARAKTL